ncbi:MAG: RNA-binding S4 domain-containing protein [Candidatus Omnitrophota bacterium]
MDEISFKLSTDSIELCRLLKATGLCESGGAAKQVITAGEVCVNGRVEIRKAFQVRSGDRVEYAGAAVLVQ